MTVSAMLVSFIAQVALGRRYGPAGFGSYSATALFVTLVTTLLMIGIPTAIARAVSAAHGSETEQRQQVATALSVAVVGAAAAFLISLLLWGPFTQVAAFAAPAPAFATAVAAGGCVLLTCLSAILLGKLAMTWVTALVVIQPFAVIGGLALGQLGLEIGPSALAVAGFAASGLAAVFVAGALRVMPTRSIRDGAGLLREALPATAVLYSTSLSGWVDRAIVLLVVGSSALGAFVAASMLVEAALRAPRNLSTFAVPAYARLAGDEVGTRRVLDSHVRLLAVFFLVVGTVFISAGADILTAIFGPGFRIAGTTLRLLAMAMVPIGIALALVAEGTGTERTRRTSTWAWVFVLQVILGTSLTLTFSIAGTALAQLVIWSVAVVLALRIGGRAVSPWTTAVIAGVCAPLWTVAWIVGTTTMWWPVRGVAVGLLALVLGARFLLHDPDRRVLAGLIRPLRKRADPA